MKNGLETSTKNMEFIKKRWNIEQKNCGKIVDELNLKIVKKFPKIW